jgi:hypothetical protein
VRSAFQGHRATDVSVGLLDGRLGEAQGFEHVEGP